MTTPPTLTQPGSPEANQAVTPSAASNHVVPTPTPPATPPNGSDRTFTAADIEKARAEEKDKLLRPAGQAGGVLQRDEGRGGQASRRPRGA